MSEEFYVLVTNKGIEVLTDCINNGVAFPANAMAVGDGNGDYYEPTATQTALVREKYRTNQFNAGKRDGYIFFQLQLPPSEGNYTIREAGLFYNNDLLAIAKYPETYKAIAASGNDKTINIEIQIKLSTTAYNTIIINDSGNYQLVSEKDSPNGYAGLDDNGLLSASLLPLIDVDKFNERTKEIIYHSTKGYLEDGTLYSDSQLYNDVYNYAHSTFDLSKFTVVGSPTITDDGVLSNGTNSNYLKIPNSVFTQFGSKKWKISWKGNLQEYGVGGIYTFNGFLNVGRFNQTENFFFNITVNDNGTPTITSNSYMGLSYNNEPAYEGYVEYNGTKYTLGIKINGQNNFTTADIENSNPIMPQSNDLNVGYNLQTGSIDLKQLSVTVDGVPVFSGNKTGIDTIKADDYTVVGSPTISAVGIASGFGSSDYLTKQNLSFGSSPWEIQGKFIFASSSQNQALLAGTSNAGAPLLYVNNSGFALNIPSSPGTWGWQLPFGGGQLAYPLTAGNSYYYKIGWDGADYYIKVSDDNENWTTLGTKTGTAMLGGSGTFDLALGSNPTLGNRYVTGSVDLNLFKIYVNNDLVYHPCLKVPYTESLTGSKIVDSAYFDSVQTVYDLYGSALYYTLDETNKKTALPFGEVYGYITQNTEDIKTKAELDFSNISSTGKLTAISWSMPDWDNKINVDSGQISTEKSYTAPSDGYISFYGLSGAYAKDAYIKINDITVCEELTIGTQDTIIGNGIYPVSKDDVVKYLDKYQRAVTFTLDFIPMKGV